MGAVRRSGEHFTPPSDFDVNRFRTQNLVPNDASTQAIVRFAPTLARIICERFASGQVTKAKDKSVQVRLSVSSLSWLGRFLLPFGTDAEILSPLEARAHLAQFCAAAAQAYQRDPEPPK
jgi:predicted DNA-binding transcriptional regulator YafY